MDIKQFNIESTNFLNMMGDRRFWQSPNKVELAKKMYGVAYLSLKGTQEELANAAITFQSMMSQFTRRACIIDSMAF